MSSSTVHQRLLEIFTLVLKEDFGGRRDVVQEEESKWDSLKHFEIVFAVEDEFGVSFTEDEISELRMLSDFERAIEGYHREA